MTPLAAQSLTQQPVSTASNGEPDLCLSCESEKMDQMRSAQVKGYFCGFTTCCVASVETLSRQLGLSAWYTVPVALMLSGYAGRAAEHFCTEHTKTQLQDKKCTHHPATVVLNQPGSDSDRACCSKDSSYKDSSYKESATQGKSDDIATPEPSQLRHRTHHA